MIIGLSIQRFATKGIQILKYHPSISKLHSLSKFSTKNSGEDNKKEESLDKDLDIQEKHQELRFTKYVKDNALDLESNKVPKGVKTSFLFVYGPVGLMTGSLLLTQFTSPLAFEYTVRT